MSKIEHAKGYKPPSSETVRKKQFFEYKWFSLLGWFLIIPALLFSLFTYQEGLGGKANKASGSEIPGKISSSSSANSSSQQTAQTINTSEEKYKKLEKEYNSLKEELQKQPSLSQGQNSKLAEIEKQLQEKDNKIKEFENKQKQEAEKANSLVIEGTKWVSLNGKCPSVFYFNSGGSFEEKDSSGVGSCKDLSGYKGVGNWKLEDNRLKIEYENKVRVETEGLEARTSRVEATISNLPGGSSERIVLQRVY